MRRSWSRLLAGSTHEERVLRWGSAVLVGFLVVGTALVLASWLFGPAPDHERAQPASAPATQDSSSRAATEPTEPTGSTSPSADGLSPGAMTGFVRRYLAAAAADPARSWRMLTPAFRQRSGSYAAYAGFWGPIVTATPAEVFADPTARRVTYTVTYTYADGHRTTDSTRLELVRRDGRLLVAAEG